MNLTIDVVPEHRVFYNKENNYGIYSCTSSSSDIVLSKWNNFSLVGYMPKLKLFRTYNMEIKEIEHPKYGIQYELVRIIEDIPQTIEEEKDFLSTILTARQVEEIYKVYPEGNIIELVQNNLFDYNLVHGVGEYTYNLIKDKITNNLIYQKALVHFSRFGITYHMIKKLVDKYTSVDLLIEKFNENPYFLADEVEGISFIKCDAYALEMGIERNSPYRINACAKHILKSEASDSGHSWIPFNKLVDKISNMLDINNDLIIDTLKSNNNDDDNLNDKLCIADDKSFLFSNYFYENQIAIKIKSLLDNPRSFSINNLDTKINNVEEQQGFKFTDEQLTAIKTLKDSNVLVVNGKAGTGKSSILNAVLRVYNEYPICTCALSGKAAQRITEITGYQSSTIHRLLGYHPLLGWSYNKSNPLPYDLIVLDEGTMVDNYLYYRLISAMKDGAKLLILGDTAQLEPIGTGNIMQDIIKSNVVPVVTLTKVHRQAEKSGILFYANKIRDGKQIVSRNDYSNKILGELKDLYILPYSKSQSVHDSVLNIAKKYKGNILDFQVLTPLKTRGINSVASFNEELQNIFNPDETLSYVKESKKNRQCTTFKLNDKVIQCGNNYDKNVFNGTIGIIKDIQLENQLIGIMFNDYDKMIYYKGKEIYQLDLAYALSIHRCQGSSFKNAIIALDYSSYKLLSRQLIYTAITRAEQYCFVCCELDAFMHAINQNKAVLRNTFLADMLIIDYDEKEVS